MANLNAMMANLGLNHTNLTALPQELREHVLTKVRANEVQGKIERQRDTNQATRDLNNMYNISFEDATENVINMGGAYFAGQGGLERENEFYDEAYESLRQRDPTINNSIIQLAKIHQQQVEALQRFNYVSKIMKQ